MAVTVSQQNVTGNHRQMLQLTPVLQCQRSLWSQSAFVGMHVEDVTSQGHTFSRNMRSTLFNRHDKPSALLITPVLPWRHRAGPDKWL